MVKYTGRLMMLLLLISVTMTLYAQDTTADVYTFPSGASFVIPPDGELDPDSPMPRIAFAVPDEDVVMILDMYDQEALELLFGVNTRNITIEEASERLLGIINVHSPEALDVSEMNTNDGRRAILHIILPGGDVEILEAFIVLYMSDTHIGMVHLRSADMLSDYGLALFDAVLASFDNLPRIATEDIILPEGTRISLPIDATLDLDASLPTIIFTEPRVRIEVIEADTFDNVVDSRSELLTLLNVMLTLLEYAEHFGEDDVIFEDFTLDGRDMVYIEFLNPSSGDDMPQIVLIVRLSDGRAGAFNIMPDEVIDDLMFVRILTIVDSFDTPYAATFQFDTAPLTETFTYESGASLRYSPDFLLDDEYQPPFISLLLPDTARLTFLDPAMLNFSPDITLADIIDISLTNYPITAADVELVSVNGRDVYVALSFEPDHYRGVFYLLFDNGGIAVVEAFVADSSTELFDKLLNVIATFIP